MSGESTSGSERFEDAMCPDCGAILTGAREPGDEDHCQETEGEVILVRPDRNTSARVVDEADGSATPWPFGPDHAVVWCAIRRHREGHRRPVQFNGDPIAEVAP